MKRNITISLLFCCFFLLSIQIKAQEHTTEKPDSVKVYKKIQDFSNRRKFTKVIYRLIFRPIHTEEKVQPVVVTEVKPVYYLPYQGKVIRNIYIETTDPFGYDSKDTTVVPTGFLQKAGNAIHVKSLPVSIKHLLIIKKYDTFDSLRVRESERLVRSQNYIREVYFTTTIVNNSDSVDINIRVYDLLSIVVTGSGSKSNLTIDVKDKNFLGLGHQLENNYHLNHTNGDYLNSTNYNIVNFRDTYINTTLHYDIDDKKNYNESITLDRPFYSVFTEWAGGASVLQHLNRSLLKLVDSSIILQTYKNNSQDYWIGRSWQLLKGKTEDERTTDFILSARYFNNHYVGKPSESIDTFHIYANENFYMIGAGFSQRKSKQDSYIFKYGYVEDVPIGRVYSFVAGYQMKGNIGRWYVGPRFYWGNYFRWGYFSTNVQYGTFIHKSSLEQGIFSAAANYFSPILNIGKWKLRQFVKLQYIQGFDRLATENLSLNSDTGIKGFNGVGLTGTQKTLVELQTQSYAPWDLWGFRFGPYFVCSFGALGKESSGFHRSPVYSQFGFGVLLKNEYLVISSFEISIAYFPYIPGVGNNIIKPNPFKTTDFGLQDASIGKPSTVSYQ